MNDAANLMFFSIIRVTFPVISYCFLIHLSEFVHSDVSLKRTVAKKKMIDRFESQCEYLVCIDMHKNILNNINHQQYKFNFKIIHSDFNRNNNITFNLISMYEVIFTNLKKNIPNF